MVHLRHRHKNFISRHPSFSFRYWKGKKVSIVLIKVEILLLALLRCGPLRHNVSTRIRSRFMVEANYFSIDLLSERLNVYTAPYNILRVLFMVERINFISIWRSMVNGLALM